MLTTPNHGELASLGLGKGASFCISREMLVFLEREEVEFYGVSLALSHLRI